MGTRGKCMTLWQARLLKYGLNLVPGIPPSPLPSTHLQPVAKLHTFWLRGFGPAEKIRPCFCESYISR